mmetsp:Transcript_16928/g.29602  ORF Transcript_16928/g.29602 Transcript_16928/m.29602 type:complete len:207 (-) Transcript_16928:287-907(-)
MNYHVATFDSCVKGRWLLEVATCIELEPLQRSWELLQELHILCMASSTSNLMTCLKSILDNPRTKISSASCNADHKVLVEMRCRHGHVLGYQLVVVVLVKMRCWHGGDVVLMIVLNRLLGLTMGVVKMWVGHWDVLSVNFVVVVLVEMRRGHWRYMVLMVVLNRLFGVSRLPSRLILARRVDCFAFVPGVVPVGTRHRSMVIFGVV